MWTKEAREQFSETHLQKFNCERCGKYCEKPHQSHKLRFCSKSCSAAANPTPAGWKHSDETKKRMSEYRIANPLTPTKGKHLSEEVKEKIRNSNRGKKCDYKGEKHWNWRGGISIIYSEDWTDSLRESIRQRDGFICQECGLHQDETLKKLHVHHIDYDKYNCNPINLITLCVSCHLKTNANREYWKEYFNNRKGE